MKPDDEQEEDGCKVRWASDRKELPRFHDIHSACAFRTASAIVYKYIRLLDFAARPSDQLAPAKVSSNNVKLGEPFWADSAGLKEFCGGAAPRDLPFRVLDKREAPGRVPGLGSAARDVTPGTALKMTSSLGDYVQEMR